MSYSKTPEPPYYAVIFGFRLRTADTADYLATADRLMEIARGLDGFFGEEAARVEGGFCLTVSYWRDEEAIRVWRENLEHTAARQRGKREWYESFRVRVARVERDYGFEHRAARQRAAQQNHSQDAEAQASEAQDSEAQDSEAPRPSVDGSTE